MPSRWPLSLRALAEIAVIGGVGRADRAAGIAGRRLHPDAVEQVLAQQLAVGDAVQRHAAGQADVLRAGLLAHRARQPDHDLLGDGLHRRREIHVMLGQKLLGLARLAAEQLAELLVRHAQAGAVVEVLLVEAEGAVLLEVDDLVEDQVLELRLAIGRQAHDLVLAGVDLEAGVVGERRIEQPERVREVDLLQHLELVALAPGRATSSPIRRRRPCTARRPLRRATGRTPRRHGSGDARRTAAACASRSRAASASSHRAAASSGTASPSATAAWPCGRTGSRAARRRGRSRAGARTSGTACRRRRRSRRRPA